MRPGTLVRLALAGGRTDVLRVVCTAFSALLGALTLLAAATVAAVPDLGEYEPNNRYTGALMDEPGLRQGVVITLLLVAVPIVALAAQSIRLGTPARDRRLAALRLAGAGPGQAVLVAAAETTAAALLGSGTGLAVFFVLHRALHRPTAQGLLPLPTDVLPPVWTIALIVLLVPVLAGAAGALLMRRVIISPLGVVRRTRDRKPSVLPGILILAGVFTPILVRPIGSWLNDLAGGVPPAAVLLVPAAAVLGVVFGTAWISHTAGRLLHRFARRPGALLAGRTLMADPWSGSRTFAALLAAVVVGAGVLAVRTDLVTTFQARDSAEETDFYFSTLDLLDLTVAIVLVVAAIGILITLAENITSRRRTYAVQIAAGVPRRTFAASIAWQTFAPLIPAVIVALTTGLWLIRGINPTERQGSTGTCSGTAAQCADPDSPFWTYTQVTLHVPVPLKELALLGAGTCALMAVVVVAGLFVLRLSTDVEELRTA